jgi:hypothetical protein
MRIRSVGCMPAPAFIRQVKAFDLAEGDPNIISMHTDDMLIALSVII